MEQKIIKVGNSFAVTIPKSFMNQIKWKAGTKVFVDVDPEEKVFIVTAEKNGKKPALTPEFYEWLKSFNAKYKDALIELAKK